MTQQDHQTAPAQLPQLLERLGVVPGRWAIDATSSVVELQATYLFGPKSTATLAVTAGHVYVDSDRTTITGEATFDAASIRTGIGLRDRHLQTARFLDVRRHPIIRFDLESAGAGSSTSTLVA